MAAALIPWIYKYDFSGVKLKDGVAIPDGGTRYSTIDSKLNNSFFETKYCAQLPFGFSSVPKFTKKNKNTDPKAPPEVDDIEVAIGSHGIIRDPKNRASFIRVGNIPDERFAESVKLFEAKDRFDETIKKALDARDIVVDKYKHNVRTSDKNEKNKNAVKYVYARAKLNKWGIPSPTDPTKTIKGFRRPDDADSDYSTPFYLGKQKLTLKQASEISYGAVVIIQDSTTSVVDGATGITAQTRITRMEFVIPGGDPDHRHDSKPVDDSYFDTDELPYLKDLVKKRPALESLEGDSKRQMMSDGRGPQSPSRSDVTSQDLMNDRDEEALAEIERGQNQAIPAAAAAATAEDDDEVLAAVLAHTEAAVANVLARVDAAAAPVKRPSKRAKIVEDDDDDDDGDDDD